MAKIKGFSKHEMPREKLIEKGAQNLRDAEFSVILQGGRGSCRTEIKRH